MSKGKGSKVFRTDGAPIPKMQKIQTGRTEERGAPIPQMQAVPNKPQSGGGQSQAGGSQTGGSGSGQSNAGKQK